MSLLKLIHREIGIIDTDFKTVEPDDEEVDAQEETHCNFIKAIGEAYKKVELYLYSRKDEADSVAPINIPDEGFRRQVEELETANKRAHEARAEAEGAERMLNALTLQDEDHHSLVSHQRPVQPPNVWDYEIRCGKPSMPYHQVS